MAALGQQRCAHSHTSHGTTRRRVVLPAPALSHPVRRQRGRQQQRCRSGALAGLHATATLGHWHLQRALVIGWGHAVTQSALVGSGLWYVSLCALSVTLGALSYNLMAVLSEFFHMDSERQVVEQERTYLHGVEVTNSRFFQDTRLLAAVEFAAEAHKNQWRKTGEPYITHCIEAALIVEACLPPAYDDEQEQERHISCMMSAVLHDVIDDTNTELSAIQAAFGPVVSGMVSKVSKLSQMNQLLRRGKRKGWTQFSSDHLKQLRKLIVDLAFEEPLVILIKLADRLHNMRTVYVLQSDKQCSVAQETMEVWCSMAESLGWDGLKSEMEDLCFAVLEPTQYCTLRAELDRLWSLPTLAVTEQTLAKGQAGGGDGAPDQQDIGLRIVEARTTRSSGAEAFGSSSAERDAARRFPTAATHHVHQPQQHHAQRATAAAQQQDSGGAGASSSSSGGGPVSVLAAVAAAAGKGLTASLLPLEVGHSSTTTGRGPAMLGARADASHQQSSSSSSSRTSHPGGGGGREGGEPARLDLQQDSLRLLLQTVVPFEAVCFKTLKKGLSSSTRRGLEVLDDCAALLYNEIVIRSQAGGTNINIQGRLKSLYSVYRKMLRKKVSAAQVYDARALRVIVDDGEGSSLQEAVDVCYKLVNAVHSIWKPIRNEFDDYIANPKPSGYQALHTAVRGPGGVPMEVQIKTSSMHELAEYGCAAHWVYKEYLPLLGSNKPPKPGAERLPAGYVGQPVLKIAKDKLRYGVIVERTDGQRLVAAVKAGATYRSYPTRVSEYSFYDSLLQYTRDKQWTVPGHGDFTLRLEEFVKGNDGRFHRLDHMGYLIPAETVTLLEGFDEDALAAQRQPAAAAAAAKAGAAGDVGEHAPAAAGAADGAAPSVGVVAVSVSAESGLDEQDGGSALSTAEQERFRQQMQRTFAKTQQLRSMLEWGRDTIGKYAPADDGSAGATDEVSVLIWPGGQIEHFTRGTTARDIVTAKGIIQTSEGYDAAGGSFRVDPLINVNNRLVPEDTVLNDGDLVILSREKVRI